MGVIKNQYFGITSNVVKALLRGLEEEWKERLGLFESRRKVCCLSAAVVIYFFGWLWGVIVLVDNCNFEVVRRNKSEKEPVTCVSRL